MSNLIKKTEFRGYIYIGRKEMMFKYMVDKVPDKDRGRGILPYIKVASVVLDIISKIRPFGELHEDVIKASTDELLCQEAIETLKIILKNKYPNSKIIIYGES